MIFLKFNLLILIGGVKKTKLFKERLSNVLAYIDLAQAALSRTK